MRRPMLPLALTAMVLALAAAAVPAHDENANAGFFEDYTADFERVGNRLVQLAEAVPAEQYSWRPNDQVRSISEVYMHVVGLNNFLPGNLGAAPPAGATASENPMAAMQDLEKTVTAKDEVVARLKESFAYAVQAVPAIQDLDAEASTFGFAASKRAYLFILLTHAHEHLGQSIAYARSIGVVPPWSQPAAGQ